MHTKRPKEVNIRLKALKCLNLLSCGHIPNKRHVAFNFNFTIERTLNGRLYLFLTKFKVRGKSRGATFIKKVRV